MNNYDSFSAACAIANESKEKLPKVKKTDKLKLSNKSCNSNDKKLNLK